MKGAIKPKEIKHNYEFGRGKHFVPGGGPKESPRTSSMVQIIVFFFLSFEISGNILRF